MHPTIVAKLIESFIRARGGAPRARSAYRGGVLVTSPSRGVASRAGSLAAILGAAVLGAACAATGEGSYLAETETGRNFGSAEDEAARIERFARRFAEAREVADAGDTGRALSLCEEALADRPPTEIRTRLVALRRELRETAFEERVMGGHCSIEGESFLVGEGVPVRLELVNRGSVPVEVPVAHSRRVESRSMFLLRVRCRDWDRQGSTVTQERSLMVPLDEAIVIEGGEAWETVYTLETDDAFFRPERVVYRRLTVSARLQPVEIRAGDLAWFAQVDLAPSSCELFPPGIEPVREDPSGTLARAVEMSRRSDAALNHVFFGGILSYRREPSRAARLLLDAAGSDRLGLRQAALATLRLVTGQNDLLDVADWESWLLDRGVIAEGATAEEPDAGPSRTPGSTDPGPPVVGEGRGAETGGVSAEGEPNRR